MGGGDGIASKFVSRDGARPQCWVMVAVMAFNARNFAVRFLSDALRRISIIRQPQREKMSGAIFLFRIAIKIRMGQIAPVKR